MDLSSLNAQTTTSLQLKNPVTDEPYDIVITGYTTHSREWKKAERAVVGPPKSGVMVLNKESRKSKEQRFELPPVKPDQMVKIFAKTITSITGLDDFEDSEAEYLKLLSAPERSWISDQWRDHLDNDDVFLPNAVPTADSGLSQ